MAILSSKNLFTEFIQVFFSNIIRRSDGRRIFMVMVIFNCEISLL